MININDFKWINESEYEITGDVLRIKSISNADFFTNPVDGNVSASAAFLYEEVEGDFRISVCVKPAFEHTYDACSIFVYADESRWLKTAFEYTDFNTRAVVTVATNGYSDDANGVNIDGDKLHLQVIRKGDVFVCHYSEDGENFTMARILRLPAGKTVKAGLSAQSPTGQGKFMEFSDLRITKDLPGDIRKSV
jgi:hypothetical protein